MRNQYERKEEDSQEKSISRTLQREMEIEEYRAGVGDMSRRCHARKHVVVGGKVEREEH